MSDRPESGTVGNFRRRLAAVLCADVAGYTRLMAKYEAATHTAYKANIDEVMKPAISAHRGRLVKSTGDGFIAVFDSVVDSVTCAVEMQREMARRNDAVPQDRRVEFRIGVNIGDVIDEGDDVYGDGVNVAARIQQELANPGEVCVSGVVHDQVRAKLPFRFDDLGLNRVKNVERPIRAFRLRTTAAAGRRAAIRRWIRPRSPNLAAGLAAALAAIVFSVYVVSPTELGRWFRSTEVQNSSALPLPDKPSLAVLPFKNISADPEQEYFADGVSEDIITDLAGLGGLFVIARNSSFLYKGRPVDVRSVGRELGVRYVLEGSVRKIDDQVRINAQLIDTTTGMHVWAKRFDSKMREIFKIQDEISHRIVSTLSVDVKEPERTRVASRKTGNFAAHDAFLRGRALLHRNNFSDHRKSVEFFETAIQLDPDYSQAHAAIAAAHLAARKYTWTNVEEFKSPLQAFMNAKKHKSQLVAKARRHLRPALRNPTSLAYRVDAEILLIDAEEENDPKKFDEAVRLLRKATEFDPNDAENFAALGITLVWNGEPAKAFEPIEKAIRIDPLRLAIHHCYHGIALFSLRRYAEATTTLNECASGNPEHHWPYVFLAASHAYLGQAMEMKNAKDKLDERMRSQKRTPFTVKEARSQIPFRYQEDKLHFLVGLHKAGFANTLVGAH